MADESKAPEVVVKPEVKRAWADEADDAETSSPTPTERPENDVKLEIDSLSIKDEAESKTQLLDEPNESDIRTVSVMLPLSCA